MVPTGIVTGLHIGTVMPHTNITINQNSTWNDHIDVISIKILRSIPILNTLKHYLTVIFSHLTYGI